MIAAFLSSFLRIVTAFMLVPFVILQWQVRHKNGIVRKLRRHIILEVSSLIVLFLTTVFFSDDGWVAVGINLLVFVTFFSGIRLFRIIRDGNYT